MYAALGMMLIVAKPLVETSPLVAIAIIVPLPLSVFGVKRPDCVIVPIDGGSTDHRRLDVGTSLPFTSTGLPMNWAV